MTSLYKQYIKERENRSIIELEHGFISYTEYPTYIFINDIFVEKAHRNSSCGRDLFIMVEDIAKNKKLQMFSSVDPKTSTATDALHFHLKMGAILSHVQDGCIYFRKEVV